MIKADHKKWAEIVFDIYLNRLLKKSFLDFRIINDLPKFDNSKEFNSNSKSFFMVGWIFYLLDK